MTLEVKVLSGVLLAAGPMWLAAMLIDRSCGPTPLLPRQHSVIPHGLDTAAMGLCLYIECNTLPNQTRRIKKAENLILSQGIGIYLSLSSGASEPRIRIRTGLFANWEIPYSFRFSLLPAQSMILPESLTALYILLFS